MNYKGIWFFGLSGSGKTTSAEYIKKNIFKDSLLLFVLIYLVLVFKDKLLIINKKSTEIFTSEPNF